MCRDLYCTAPKTLEARHCIDTVEYLTGLAYEVFLKLTTSETDVPIGDLNDAASDAWDIYQHYLFTLGVSQLVYERTLYFQKSTLYSEFIDTFVLHCKLYFDGNAKQSNVFVNSILNLEKNAEVFLRERAVGYRMTLGYYHTAELNGVSTNCSGSKTLLLDRVVSVVPKLQIPEYLDGIDPILVTKVLGCPLIELKPSEYSFEYNTKCIYVKEIDAKLQPGTYRMNNFSNILTVYICAEDFIALLKQSRTNRTIPQSVSVDSGIPQGILSVVCTCFSLLCLLLTLITYSLFQELRTQPGINNMALVICLMIAQTLFQFGTNPATTVPEWGCQVIGALVHFFWLMVMLWMNVCCIHMFRVFMAIKNCMSFRKTCKQTVIYLAYTVVIATTLVLMNIIVSVYHPNYDGVGYGGTICYIKDYKMVGCMFAIPVGIIVILNLALFNIVVMKICRTPIVKSETKSTRNLFAIYAKISTITGVSWLFGFIYIFTEIQTMEYLFIIFNAAQGVFVFLAFVCNKRVVGMYRRKFGLADSEQSVDSITKQNSTCTALTEVTTKTAQ